MNRRTPKALQILAATVASLFLALYAAGQSAGTSDFWSLIRIGDQAVGYFRETARPSVDGRTITAIDSVVALNRLGDKVEIIQKAEIEESADGSLLKISGHISSSKQTTLIEALVKEGVIELQTSAGGKTYS